MKKYIYLFVFVAAMVAGCDRHEVPEPQIHDFTANPTTLPHRDTVSFTIDAEGDHITFYDGKATLDLSDEEMPYESKVGKMRFRVTAPADTVWVKLAVTNVYDAEHIKTKIDSIEIILLDQ